MSQGRDDNDGALEGAGQLVGGAVIVGCGGAVFLWFVYIFFSYFASRLSM